MHHDKLFKGAMFIIAAELMFASMGASIRMVSEDVGNATIVFARNLFALFLLAPLFLKQGANLKTKVPMLHLLRGVMGVSAMFCFFYAIAHMPLADAMLLKLASPLFIPFVALFWLHERFTYHVLIALAVGFTGVGIILMPNFSEVAPVAAIALLGGVFAAVAKVTVRRLSATEPSQRTVYYFAIVGTIVSGVSLIWFGETVTWEQIKILILVSIFASLGQLAMTQGFACAPAARLAPFTFFSVVFGALLGWYFWEEIVTLATLGGALLVMLSGFITGRGRRETAS